MGSDIKMKESEIKPSDRIVASMIFLIIDAFLIFLLGPNILLIFTWFVFLISLGLSVKEYNQPAGEPLELEETDDEDMV